MRVCLLLIALAALSYSAPISNNKHELEAQKLYGSLFSLIKAEKTDEAVNIVIEKYAYFFPGLIDAEMSKKLKAAIANKDADQGAALQKLQLALTLELLPKVMVKVQALGVEAQGFLGKATTLKLDKEKLLGNLGGEMNKLIASFDALSPDAQTQLKEQFPFFTKLDELRSYAVVLDRIVKSLKDLCKELPGFEDCKMFV